MTEVALDDTQVDGSLEVLPNRKDLFVIRVPVSEEFSATPGKAGCLGYNDGSPGALHVA